MSDYALPSESIVEDRWLTSEEKLEKEKERKERLQQLEEQDIRSNKPRVISIDLQGRKVIEMPREALQKEIKSDRFSNPRPSIPSGKLFVESPNVSTESPAVNPAKHFFADNPLLSNEDRLLYISVKDRKQQNAELNEESFHFGPRVYSSRPAKKQSPKMNRDASTVVPAYKRKNIETYAFTTSG